MKYNFDEVIDRSHNRSSKYDERVKKFGTADVIPLWVADMDFACAPGIVEALRALRTRLAKEENVPAYVIFSNATLTDMAAKAPRTAAELLEVSGVGQVKADRYGRQLLDKIARHIQQNE